MTAVSEQIGNWVAEFAKQPTSPFQALREAAFERFSGLGFPTTREEEWRFTNVGPIARREFKAAAPAEAQVADFAPWSQSGVRLVFVNGFLVQAPAQLPKGVQAGNLAIEAGSYLAKVAGFERNPFVALNTAFLNHGAYVRIERGTVLEEPVQIVFITTGEGVHVHPRVLLLVGAAAQCRVVETYAGAGSYFTNAVTEIVVGENAVVDHYKVTVEASQAFHIATTQAELGRSANYSSHSISLGGLLVRNNAGAVLSEGTEATLNGLYIARGVQHIDNHTVIDHVKPHGTSHELYKGILDGRAAAVFNGRIVVRKDAQKTDSKQTNKNLVLSDEAVIDTKPELQIFADDVRCTHGATIGQIDTEAMFYLRSRGIGQNEARNLLIYAFAQEIVDRIQVPALREALERSLFEKFHEHAH
jgi:Fe-S cluster assembly protein SufD